MTPNAPLHRPWHFVGSIMAFGALLLAGSVAINMAVAVERTQVEKLRRQLVQESKLARELEAERELRSSDVAMRTWNDSDLHLVPAQATQYLRSPVQLASFAATPATPAAKAEPAFQLAVAVDAAGKPGPAVPVLAAAPAAPAALPQVVKASWRAGQPAVTER